MIRTNKDLLRLAECDSAEILAHTMLIMAQRRLRRLEDHAKSITVQRTIMQAGIMLTRLWNKNASDLTSTVRCKLEE